MKTLLFTVVVCSLIAAFVIDWRAAGLMFVAAWADNMLRGRVAVG